MVAFILRTTIHNLHYEQIGKEVRCIEDELPFEIPDTWKWDKWGNISFKIQYGYNAAAKEKGKIKMVRISDIQDNKVVWESVPFCDISDSEINDYLLHNNDLLFARTGGTVGKSFLVENINEVAIYAGYLIRTVYDTEKLIPKYLKYFMESSLYWNQLRKGTIATAQPNCNGQTLSNMFIPIPPLNEQQRIVCKIKELEPLIDKYKLAEEKLYELNSNIKNQLKKSILQYAIEGKLVPQNSNDEPASVLLEKIHEEKERLIKEGKIKRNENESIIYRRDNSYYEKQDKYEVCIDEQIPFDIPKNWMWTRLSNVANTLGGYAFKSSEYKNRGIRVIRISDFDNNGILDDEYKFYQENIMLNKYLLSKNDILLCMTGGTVGKVCINDREIKQYLNQRVAAIRINNLIYHKYIYKVITSNYIQNIINKSKTSTNDNISMNLINEFLIPLPPFNEQVKICNALDRI